MVKARNSDRDYNYARAALENEIEKVANTGEGSRNTTLNNATLKLGSLVAAGLLEENEVSARLLEAARQCGLPPAEATATIASGMRYGMQHPRSRPNGGGQDYQKFNGFGDPPHATNDGDEGDEEDAAPSAAAKPTRKRLPAPGASDERLPVMRALDDALLTNEAEPPMRGLDEWPLEIRLREPMGVHELTASTANDEDDDNNNSRLPPPPMHMLVRHDACSLVLLIERHVEFFVIKKKVEIAVALSAAFVTHYLRYRDSKLPKVGAIVTMPMALPNGELLATNGLDRKRKIVLRIEPDILELLPQGKILGAQIEEARCASLSTTGSSTCRRISPASAS